ncbi:MAG: type IV pilus twitching motility protein PilT [Chloroflexota bacterium]|nr:type IV pilus twitching motility protein PilT [Chloroflexota bacterium]
MPPLHELLRRMGESGASDLHISLDARPAYRRHGALAPEEGLPAATAADLEGVLATVATAEEQAALMRTREMDKALDLPGAGRFRVNVGFERGSLYCSFRLVNSSVLTIEELGLPPICDRLTQLPRGLVLVTGPTGSGKSTTLASMIDRINEREARHIVTVEDPIEYVHSNKRSIIHQREVGADTTSFAEALRRVLRQDPDVILVGEMRDLETIGAAITAAETGHLVFATLHTPDAPQTIDRIVDAFPSHQQQQIRMQLSMVAEAIISQVLVPTAGGDGRVVACEVMLGTSAVRNLIREGKTHQIPTVMATGSAIGMRTREQALAELVRGGVIVQETALAVASSPEELGRLLGVRAQHAA